MPTPVFCCGFECGVEGPSSTGFHWDLIGTASFSTSTVRSGSRSVRVNPTAGTGQGFSYALPSFNIAVMRIAVRFATLPSVTVAIFYFNTGGAWFNPADSKIYAGYTGGVLGATGVAVTTGVWYYIDVRSNTSANPWVIDVQVNGVACSQLTRAVAGVSNTNVEFGASTASNTSDIYFDDFILSHISADYPIGNGYVHHFVPTSDGTHSGAGGSSALVKGTIAAPTGGGNVAGATDVFNWVNGVPLLGGASDNTRLVNQQTATVFEYAEEIFGPAPGISTPIAAPRAVEVITADRQASTAVGGFSTRLNDNGTESVIITRSAAGVITDRYVTKQYALAPTGGAWTVVSGAGNFKNIRARFGYSADANPDQYWRGIMIEAEFVAPVPNKIVNIKQAVNRANTY